MALVVYLPTLAFGFVFDDRYQVLGNAWITSWRYLPNLFTHHVWMFNDPSVVSGNYWRPVFLTWLLINHTLFALKPVGWHLTSILAHVAVTWAVYRLSLRLTGDAATAAISALLFAVHPIHNEAVAWVSGMTDPLLAFFFLAALLAWFRYREQGRTRWLAISLVCYAASMLSKEPGIVLPAIVAVLCLTGLDRVSGKNGVASVSDTSEQGKEWRDKIAATLRATAPFLAVAALYLVGRYFVLRGMSHPLGTESLTSMVLTWPAALWFYARQLVFPVGLSGFYDLSVVSHPGLLNFVLPLAGVLMIAAALWLLSRRARQPLIAFCGWWMLITLLPVLYIVLFPTWDIVHDRYLYLPSFGFVLLLALGIRRLGISSRPIRGVPAAQGLIVLVLAGAYCASGIPDQKVWADDFSLYRRGFTVAPNNAVPKLDLAIILMQRNDDAPRAIELFREVVARDPNQWEATYDLGYSYVLTQQNREAEVYLTRAIALRPQQAAQYSYRAVARYKLGDLQGAADDARHALQLVPNGKRYHYTYGLILEKQGQLAAAAAQYRAELQLDPDDQLAKDSLVSVTQAQAGSR